MRTIALPLSVVFALLATGCSGDTGTKKLDKGVKKDKGPSIIDTGAPDQPPVTPDLPVVKLDRPLTNPDQPVVKTDAKVDQSVVKTDQPTVKVDAKKDGPVTTPDVGKKDGVPPVPGNSKCASPRLITLSGTPAKGVESGWTTGAVDEFSTIDCSGDLSFAMEGPQVYYKVNLLAGKTYKATLTSGSFDGALYVFPAATACTATAIDTACLSPGGDNIYSSDSSSSGGDETVRIAPTATGDWMIVVDSYDVAEEGTFTLTVEEYTPPTNGKCATPQAVTLTTSPVTVTGDTSLSGNEFGSSIECSSGFGYDGPQLYYKMSLLAGKTYTFDLAPASTWDAAIYAFTDTTCTAATIETQCSATGMFADDGLTGDPEQIKITPTTTADYIIAVDSYLSTDAGTYTLKVTWQ